MKLGGMIDISIVFLCIVRILSLLLMIPHDSYFVQVNAPEKVYTDPQAKTQCYDEMWTGDWWWKTQVGPCKTCGQRCTLIGDV